jgi:hypothetical protein
MDRYLSLILRYAVPLYFMAMPITASAQDSARILATSGVVQIEGAGGGGLVPWAVISGYGSRDSIGATAHDTYVHLSDFDVNAAGLAIGFFDRVEVSYSHDWLYTGSSGTRLGLGKDYQFHMDVFGAKVRLAGHLVYDQDSWMPQIAVGAQYKAADRNAIVHAVGARDANGTDFYVAATKLFLAESLLTNLTLTATRANQFGFLGFGGDKNNGYTLQGGASAALLVTHHLAIGSEYRTKPDNLRFAKEGNAFDVFAAYFITKNVSATLAYANLGPVALQGTQAGPYLSLTAGF